MKRLDKHIEIDFGSKFQENTHTIMINAFLKALAEHIKTSHKRNRIWINGKEF